MNVISVIVGSTREGRFSEKPAKWILQHLKKREGVDARLLDLEDGAHQRVVISHCAATTSE
jgi:NAD(P)H-dependent FMN reductase